jgi:hypothetical protein
MDRNRHGEASELPDGLLTLWGWLTDGYPRPATNTGRQISPVGKTCLGHFCLQGLMFREQPGNGFSPENGFRHACGC